MNSQRLLRRRTAEAALTVGKLSDRSTNGHKSSGIIKESPMFEFNSEVDRVHRME